MGKSKVTLLSAPPAVIAKGEKIAGEDRERGEE